MIVFDTVIASGFKVGAGGFTGLGSALHTGVRCAFKAVDRGHFWVEGAGEFAYIDMPLRHDRLHPSALYIYANALESRKLAPRWILPARCLMLRRSG